MSSAILTDLTFDEYRAIDAVNFSTLKHVSDSPAHYREACERGQRQTPAMGKGIAAHCAVLEPDQFPLRFVVYDGKRQGNAWKEFKEVNAARDIITRDEYDLCIAVRDAVAANADAAAILTGRSELVVTWTDVATGLDCKARLDHVRGDNVFADLKMCPSTEMFRFERHSADMLYHCQLAWYRRGLSTALDTAIPRPRIIACEWDKPHDVGVFQLTDDALFVGERRVEEWLQKVATCRELDKWPGRYTSEQDLTIPPWRLDEEDGGLGITIGGSKA